MVSPLRRHAAGYFALALCAGCLMSSHEAAASAKYGETRALTNAPDASQPGPETVSTGEYKFAATIDNEILPSIATEIWARVFWPKNLTHEPHPILFFLHGNHPTCGSGSNPRIDNDCSYTRTGTCPEGMIVTPNHEGYNYLGQQLASWGYVVVSINANRGITCGDGNSDDWGLNLARGRLILRHLEQWYQWSTQGGAPESLGLGPEAWKGVIDFQNVGLMGHSRGGEGVRAAYNLYKDEGSPWPARIPGLDIKGIYEIGAVDGQAGRVLDADDTAWNQLLPMCDGDVSDLEGRLPFERMIEKRAETRKTPKSLYMVWGANHNFFNTEWQTSDTYDCVGHEGIFGPGPVSEAQEKVALESVSAFFRAHVGRHTVAALAENFDPTYSVPKSVTSITRIQRDHIATADVAFAARVEEFDQATGTNSNDVPNAANGIQIEHEQEEPPQRAKISWQGASTANFLQVNWSADGAGRDISALATLDFRVSRQDMHRGETEPTDFSVQLVDANGRLSSEVPVSRFVEILGPAHEYVVVYQTVRIPLSEFGPIDRKAIHGIRFVFDRSTRGGIYLANIRFAADPGPWINLKPQLPLTLEEGTSVVPPRPPRPPATPLSFQAGHRELRESTARLIGAKQISGSSRFGIASQARVEIVVQAPDQFPVEDALPTLVMNGVPFSQARYAPGGKIDKLIFTIPQKVFVKLPPTGRMHIQYGRKTATKVWRLPDYNKAELSH